MKSGFHDQWAFYMYVTTMVAYAVSLPLLGVKYDDLFRKIVDKDNFDDIPQIALYCINYSLLSIFLTLIVTFLFPAIAVLLSAIIPVLETVLLVYHSEVDMTDQRIKISTLIVIIVMIIESLYILKYIRKISDSIRFASKVIFKNILQIFVFLFSYNIFLMLIYIIFGSIDFLNNKLVEISTSIVLFWTIFNLDAFVKVMFSSYGYSEYHKSKKSGFIDALKSIGSICFGGFIYAIIKTSSIHVREERAKKGEKGEFDLYYYILSGLSLFSDILDEAYLYCANFAYIYMGIHGTSLKESIRESSNLITKSNPEILAGEISLQKIFNILKFNFFIQFIAIFYNLFSSNSFDDFQDALKFIVTVSICSIGSIAIYFNLLNILEILALTYLFIN